MSVNAVLFWARVDRRTDDECWEWLAGSTNGYGAFYVNGRMMRAHRIALALHGVDVPDGAHVHHKCRNTRCVNPAHLEAVTPREHTRITLTDLGRWGVCRNGHAMDGDNLYVSPRGKRSCRACRRDRKRAERAASKAVAR